MTTTPVISRRLILAFGAALLLSCVAWSADDKGQSDIDKRIEASATVLERDHGYA